MKELNQGQDNNTHLEESFLIHIARVFGFASENPLEAKYIWGITPIFWERLKFCKFLSQANKLKFFKRIWNNLYGLMAGEISSHILDWNTECLNFNFWQLGRMWPQTPQKWQTETNLGTSVFLVRFSVTGFGYCLNKEQFGLIWPITPQRWQVGTKTNGIITDNPHVVWAKITLPTRGLKSVT